MNIDIKTLLPRASQSCIDANPHLNGGSGKQNAPQPILELPRPRQNKTEIEFGLILDAMQRRGEILDYRPFGMKLEWGCDPVTGKPMVYSPDYTVFEDIHLFGKHRTVMATIVKFIEVKGPHIYEKDLIRFKGCRACWPNFQFEMHQKKKGQWTQLF